MHHIFTTAQSQLSHWCQLVGGIPTPLKNLTSSVGIIIPNIWTVMIHSCSKPPTSIHIYIYPIIVGSILSYPHQIPLIYHLQHFHVPNHQPAVIDVNHRGFFHRSPGAMSLAMLCTSSSVGRRVVYLAPGFFTTWTFGELPTIWEVHVKLMPGHIMCNM